MARDEKPLFKYHLDKLTTLEGREHVVESYQEGLAKLASTPGFFFVGGRLQTYSALEDQSIPELSLYQFEPEDSRNSYIMLYRNNPFTRILNRGKKYYMLSRNL